MKKFFLSTFLAVVFTGYVVYQNGTPRLSYASASTAGTAAIASDQIPRNAPEDPPAKAPAIAERTPTLAIATAHKTSSAAPPAPPPPITPAVSPPPAQISASPPPLMPAQTPAPVPAPAPVTSTPAPAPVVPAPAPVAPPKKPSGLYIDGTYTGNVADAYYGNVQVQATIQNGKLTGVQFLQYPSDRRTSQDINSQAMPYLQSEAIQAQSANVDTVSGATLTSEAFRQSLSFALSQAKA